MSVKSRALFGCFAFTLLTAAWVGLEPYPFKTPRFFPEMPVPSYSVTVQGVALGRMLFYDPILSQDSTISCASCHRQSHAFSDGGKRSSIGHAGTLTQRNTPPLFNLAWHPTLFADGRAGSIEEQVFHPVRDSGEMALDWVTAATRVGRSARYRDHFHMLFGQQEVDSNMIAQALGQFLRSLISADSRYDRVLRGEIAFTHDEAEGFRIANEQNKGDCMQCHTTDSDALGSTFQFSNNGLDERGTDPGRAGITGSPSDHGKFKIPSLRNVALTAPFMHDGRFASLVEVIEFYDSGVIHGPQVDPRMGSAPRGGVHLTVLEKKQLLAFLLTLTDSTFISRAAHSDPFMAAPER